MPKIDRVKEELGWLKVFFAIFVATDLSLVAWVAQNFEEQTLFLSISSVISIFVVTVIIVWINKIAYKKIDSLEEL